MHKIHYEVAMPEGESRPLVNLPRWCPAL